MTLSEKIKTAYPELNNEFMNGTIVLQNDSDGKGDYIAVWNYNKPLPEGLVVVKANDVSNS